MSQTERRKRRQKTTQLQYSIYVNFLEENPPFFENKSVYNNSDYLKSKWIELADLLNKCPGPTLSVRLWKSVLTSWRCDVRRKSKLLANSTTKSLTTSEEKFVELTRRYSGVHSYVQPGECAQQSVVDSTDVIECYELHNVDNVKIEADSYNSSADETAATDDKEDEVNNKDPRYPVTVWSEMNNPQIEPDEIPDSRELNEVLENKTHSINKANYKNQQKQKCQNEVDNNKEKHHRKRKRSDASINEKNSSYKPPELAANEAKSIADALNFLASNMSRLADSMSSISHSQSKIAEAQTKQAEAETKLAEAKLAKYKQMKLL